MGSQPFVHRGQGSLAMETVTPHLWGPQSLVYGDNGPSTTGATVPHLWGPQPLPRELTAPHPPGHPPRPAGDTGVWWCSHPGVLPCWHPRLAGNPGDKGGHCHLEASLGIVSPKPGSPRCGSTQGDARQGVPVVCGDCVSPSTGFNSSGG